VRRSLGIAAMALTVGLSACASVRPQTAAGTPPPGAQYLYGSGEAAALEEQAFNVLVLHARQWVASEKARPGPRVSAILTPDATLDQPVTLPCRADQPRAVLFDMDETLVANLGYEYGDAHHDHAYDDASWARFEKTGEASVAAMPGEENALFLLRNLGLTIVVNTNRNAASADVTARTLAGLGLGTFRHGDTLFLKGDVDGKGAKDGRRAAIAARYCVIAQVGDQLGDFTDRFTGSAPERRAATQLAATRGLFGTFWFVMPNSAYGTGLAGSWSDVFPTDKRWIDPATKKDRN